MITPFSQFVGTQAVLNVVHGERYRIVPNEVKKYALGYYGKLLAPVDPDVLDRIVENGSKDISLKPAPLAPAVRALRKKYPNASDDERLLRYMLAGTQVDEMLAAGPMDTSYTRVVADRRSGGQTRRPTQTRPHLHPQGRFRAQHQLELAGMRGPIHLTSRIKVP